MKICYLSYHNPLTFHGGAERVVLREAELVAQHGHDVIIITTHGGKNVQTHRLSDGKIKMWLLPEMPFKNAPLVQKCTGLLFSFYNPFLTRLVDRILGIEKPDIVHVHNPAAMSINVVKVAKRHGCNVIQTFHGYNFECPKGSLYRRSGVICNNPLPICNVYRRIFRNTVQGNGSIVALCSFVRERLIKAGYDPSNINLIPNSLQDNHKAILSRSKSREILFVGRMVRAKGVHVLIKALAKVNTICDTKFIVNLIGDGEDKSYFEDQARSLGVASNFLGNVSDAVLHKHYEEAYVVVMPSLFPELFPMVALEAMSHGKPIIASNIGGLPDLVLNKQTGLLFEANDADALAECIKSLLCDAELASVMGRNALEMSLKFSDTNHLEKLLDLYNKVSLRSEGAELAKKNRIRIHSENVAMLRKKVEMRSWGSNGADTASGTRAETPPHTYDVELLRKSVQGVDLQKKSILNVAGGRGKEAGVLIQTGCGELVLGDIAKVQLLGAKSRKEKKRYDNLELILLDAEHLPFRFKTFDFGYICMGLHHVPNPYRAISELCNVSRGKVIFVDIMNPLITKILGFFGLFKIEGSGMEPIRLEKRKVESTLNQRQMRVNISYFFVPPPLRGGNVSYETLKSLASVLNCLMILTKQKLGPLFGNVAVIRGEK